MKMVERNCSFCNKIFNAQQKEINRGNGLYCSRVCAANSRQRESRIDYRIKFDEYDKYNTVHIELTKGFTSIIDKEDLEKASMFKWKSLYCGHSDYYRAARSYRDENGKYKTAYLHRHILNAGEHDIVDHINHNPLDNRKINLRIVSHQENMKNVKLRTDNKTGICGVSWYPRTNKWHVQICSDGENKHLGYYDDLDQAIEVRKKAEEDRLFHKNHGLILKREYHEQI